MNNISESLHTKIAASGLNTGAEKTKARNSRNTAENFQSYLTSIQTPKKQETPPSAKAESNPNLNPRGDKSALVTPTAGSKSVNASGSAKNTSAAETGEGPSLSYMLEQLQEIANKAGNVYARYTDQQRGDLNEDFAKMKQQITEQLSQSESFKELGESGVNMLNTLSEMDVSSVQGAQEAFTQLHNIQDAVAVMNGTYEFPQTDGNAYEDILQQLLDLANTASSFPDPAWRETLNGQFQDLFNQFFDEVEASGHMPGASISRDLFYNDTNILSNESAQEAFYELSQLQSGLDYNRDALGV